MGGAGMGERPLFRWKGLRVWVRETGDADLGREKKKMKGNWWTDREEWMRSNGRLGQQEQALGRRARRWSAGGRGAACGGRPG